MTLAEFKAWFSGFTEDMDGTPNEKQWKKIKARVKEIDGVAVTKTVFVDHYVPPYRRYWWNDVVYGTMPLTASSTASSGQAWNDAVAKLNEDRFDSHMAMIALGKLEYQS